MHARDNSKRQFEAQRMPRRRGIVRLNGLESERAVQRNGCLHERQRVEPYQPVSSLPACLDQADGERPARSGATRGGLDKKPLQLAHLRCELANTAAAHGATVVKGEQERSVRFGIAARQAVNFGGKTYHAFANPGYGAVLPQQATGALQIARCHCTPDLYHLPYVTLKVPHKIMKTSDESHSENRTLGARFERLVAIMQRLRAPGGCPWDREQTYDTIKPYTIEETYEVLDAVDQRDYAGLCEELGDFMLQAVFYAQIASEEGRFSIADSLDAINEKLVRRHPHVFADGDAKTSDQVLTRWEQIKAGEKSERGEQPKGCLDGVPRALPALMESLKISQKAAKTGFEWPDFEQVLEKFHEETAELAEARANGRPELIEGELGDLLFTVVNMARWLNVDPEQALRKTNAKFRARFAHVETSLAAQGKSLEDSTLEEMEALWQQAKSLPESR